MRQLFRTLTTLAVLAMLSTLGSGGEQKATVHGAWTLSAITMGDKETPTSGVSFFFYSDGVFEIHEGGKKNSGTYKVTAEKGQQRLDILLMVLAKESVTKAVYDVTGDSLRIGYGMKNDSRPESFEAAKLIMTFKRFPGVKLK